MDSVEPEEWKSKQAAVVLIPWDPDSEAHAQRLYTQRVACGWHQDKIEEWKILQREGKINLQWVVLSNDDPDRNRKLSTHLEKFPSEQTTLEDSASSFGGKKRDPPRVQVSFIPVGHISLAVAAPEPEIEEPQGSVYVISTFYISEALQHGGLGRAAMDIIESTATQEPLSAKVLTLNTIARDHPNVERRQALGMPPLKIVNQDWYERRGYTVYKHVPNSYPAFDRTGKLWTVTAVYMKKQIA